MQNLRDLILSALQSLGCGVWESLELWNTEYIPLINSTKGIPGKHKIAIGKYEITYKRTK